MRIPFIVRKLPLPERACQTENAISGATFPSALVRPRLILSLVAFLSGLVLF
jgi:hypothetical protein